jgi:arylsulfatase A-like enzyme
MQTDGGQRVPFIAAWPGRIPGGQVFEEAVWQLDASATTLAVANAPVDERIEGVNLMPWLTGRKKGKVHDALYWRWRSQAAILSGHWKFVRLGNERRYLFDMRQMGKETAADNKIDRYPEIAEALEKKLRAKADTWKIPGLPDDVVGADRLFYDLHVDQTLPLPPLGEGRTGAFIPWNENRPVPSN